MYNRQGRFIRPLLNTKIMAQEKEKEQDRTILPQDDVLVEYTDKAQYHPAGHKERVHSLLAEKFVKRGVAKIAKG